MFIVEMAILTPLFRYRSHLSFRDGILHVIFTCPNPMGIMAALVYCHRAIARLLTNRSNPKPAIFGFINLRPESLSERLSIAVTAH
jgi:hypothetical protein